MVSQGRLRSLSLASLLILLVCGLYISARSSFTDHQTYEARTLIYRLTISVPRLGADLPTFEARQGDTVTILISSDRSGEADIHGYEKKIDLYPDTEVALSVAATVAGVFPLHLHEQSDPGSPVTHRHLATLEVQPK